MPETKSVFPALTPCDTGTPRTGLPIYSRGDAAGVACCAETGLQKPRHNARYARKAFFMLFSQGFRSCPASGGKEKWRILPVGEVHDQRAALQGGHWRNKLCARVSRKMRGRESLRSDCTAY